MSLVSVEQLQAELLGKEFPIGHFTIEDYQHWLTVDAVLGQLPADGVAHPMYGYFAAVTGMGITLEAMFALCHASSGDGLMFGEASLEFGVPLRVGESYTITGGFSSVTRKESARIGVMDLIGFELTVSDREGRMAAISSNTFIYPRRSP